MCDCHSEHHGKDLSELHGLPCQKTDACVAIGKSERQVRKN